MANIKDLKKRIKSTKNTFKITSAMKLVSASKLAKVQGRITGFKPYALELDNIIRTVSSLSSEYEHDFFKENEENKHSLLLVVSSDKGLCGSYNSQLFKAVKNFLKNTDEEMKVYFIGKKVRELLKKEHVNIGKTYFYEKAEPTFEEAKSICAELAEEFLSGEVSKVYVAHNAFQSAIEFHSEVKQMLPFSVDEEGREELLKDFPVDFIYEPSAKDILDDLIPEALNTSFFAKLLDAVASEHGSRMSTMESASKNCKEMIRKLTLKMNKLRQAAITTELIEVVSGAESLNS